MTDSQNIYQNIIQATDRYQLNIMKTDDFDREESIKADDISHFLLRVAYAGTEENHHWFVKMETKLFSARIKQLTTAEINNLIQELNIKFSEVEPHEFEQKKEQIINGSIRNQQKTNRNLISHKDFIKVNFLDSLMFLPNLQVYLHKGIAYFYRSDLNLIAIRHFKTKLYMKIKKAYKYYKAIVEEDDRIGPILKGLPNFYFGKDFSKERFSEKMQGKVRLNNLESVAMAHFPPCMRNLYDSLKREHHLKHEGRLQLGLFLKGAGLTMEDQMQFWKGEFTKKLAADKFEKQYAYNIRHMYGKEGNKKDYDPKSCVKIINSSMAAAGEHHGCPFKNFDAGNLSILLKRMGIQNDDLIQIVQKKKENHLQVACRKTFEALHPGMQANGVGIHPNSYIENVFKSQKDQ